MTINPTTVAKDFFDAIQAAWNDADGQAFGAAFEDDAAFVDVRGIPHESAAEIGTGHHELFHGIYKDSVVRYEAETARVLGDGVVLVRGRGTLDVPAGPMAGVHESRNTVVLVPNSDEWRAVSFHNTLVTG